MLRKNPQVYTYESKYRNIIEQKANGIPVELRDQKG